MSKRVLWYVFHPDLSSSRGNKALLGAADGLDSVTIVDAYSEYADYAIDVAREQDRLRAADVVVFQHPFYWYSSPALFKKWQDDVLTHGFAYPPKEGTALHGKHWLPVITTGGPGWSYEAGGYNNYTMSELLRPLQQTANLCGMRWHSPFVVHGVLPADYEGISATGDDELAQQAEALRARIERLDPAERRSLEPLAPPHFLDAGRP
ncbi:MAG: NAD(P)H-dependent oxidoreductase [Planctomycetota bacterium]